MNNIIKLADGVEINTDYPVIIVYQMGKVGSNTIRTTLNKLKLPNPVLHSHVLVKGRLEQRLNWRKSINIRLIDLEVNQSIINILNTRFKEIKWKVITLAREPIITKISGEFQTIYKSHPDLVDNNKLRLLSTLMMIKKNFNDFNFQQDYQLNWFDEELKIVFGVDVYSKPYDFKKGFNIFKNDNVDVLLIRLEDLNKNLPAAMKDFLGIENVYMTKTNIGDDKNYADAYKFVKKYITISKEICDKIYNSKYVKHFYSSNEIKEFKRYWTCEKIDKEYIEMLENQVLELEKRNSQYECLSNEGFDIITDYQGKEIKVNRIEYLEKELKLKEMYLENFYNSKIIKILRKIGFYR